ncbi:unnamed protein product, partial [Ixodes pacificus]
LLAQLDSDERALVRIGGSRKRQRWYCRSFLAGQVLERSDLRNLSASNAERQGAALPKRPGRWSAAHAAHRRRENHLGHRTATLKDRWLKPGTSRVRSSEADAKDDY